MTSYFESDHAYRTVVSNTSSIIRTIVLIQYTNYGSILHLDNTEKNQSTINCAIFLFDFN